MTAVENTKKQFTAEAEMHRDYLYRYAVKLTGNSDDAEDLVQETFIRAYLFFDKYRLGSNCRAWLFRIMKNLFLNFLRKKKNIENYNIGFEQNEYRMKFEPEYLDNSMSDECVVAINAIKDEYRMVLILFHLENYSLADISEFLKWPLGTVKSRLHRARIEVRNQLLN
jgi:RNA polymerase sigma-70 factor, ECF subfamily